VKKGHSREKSDGEKAVFVIPERGDHFSGRTKVGRSPSQDIGEEKVRKAATTLLRKRRIRLRLLKI